MVTLRSIIRTFVSIGLLVGLALSPAFAQPAFDPPGLERAIEAQERHTNDLLGIQGVVGTAVGLGANGQAVVKIYTERSGIGGLPRSLDGVPVGVQVTGRIFALNKPDENGNHNHGGGGGTDEEPPTDDCPFTTDRYRPACIGISTGHPDITAGTIGARVTDDSNVYALSNNHVYADENSASIGDSVLQPGTYDGGNPDGDEDVIGTLFAFEPLVFAASNCTEGAEDPDCNTVDAAIAISSTANLGNATPSDGYGTPKSTTVSASINQKVMKYGRTTGQTNGKVDAINATINVGYGSGVARFVDQIVIRPGNFSAGGDSGSLVVVRGGADNRKPVGLLFAGSLVVTIVNPISDVLSELENELDLAPGTLSIDGTP